MEIKRELILHNRKVTDRLSSTLQDKIKPMVKAYTIFGFMINKENQTFQFQKSHKKRHSPIRIDDKNIYNGSYIIQPIEEDQSKLIITIYTS